MKYCLSWLLIPFSKFFLPSLTKIFFLLLVLFTTIQISVLHHIGFILVWRIKVFLIMAVVTTNVRHILSFQTVFKSKEVFFAYVSFLHRKKFLFDRTDGIISDFNRRPENFQNNFFLLVLIFSANNDDQSVRNSSNNVPWQH